MADESWRLSTAVQELAAGAVEPLNQFVLRGHDLHGTLLLPTDMPEPIPVIDLSKLPTADEAAKLQSALQSWGLFLVSCSVVYLSLCISVCLVMACNQQVIYLVQATNHGIEASLMDAMMGASRDFFHQPLKEKQKYSNLIDGKHFQVQGYGNDMVVSQDQILDWHDRLHLRVEPEEDRDFTYWPKHPESFRLSIHFPGISSNVMVSYIMQKRKKNHV
jgi:isopenicillin N synthase-like dioxygenase